MWHVHVIFADCCGLCKHVSRTSQTVRGLGHKLMAALRVLSIDGGGIRGVVPLRILQTLEKEANGKRPAELFDVICGTSTGGILAILLGCLQLDVATCTQLYERLGNEIFDVRTLRKLWTGATEAGKFSGQKMIELVQRELKDLDKYPDIKLNDPKVREGPRVFATSSRDGHTFLFRNYDDAYDGAGRSDVCLWQAIRATSAAPIYFPSMVIDGAVYLDGGMGRNNPTSLAVAEIARMKAFEKRPIGYVVSLGTGRVTYKVYDNKILSLPGYLTNVATDCERVHEDLSSAKHDFAYDRFNPGNGVGDYDLSDVAGIDAMVRATEAYISEDTIAKRLRALAHALAQPSTVPPAGHSAPPPPDLDADRVDRLVKMDKEYTANVDKALLAIKRIQATRPYPLFVQDYAHIADEERNSGPDAYHEWTVHRKTLYNFWENFEKTFRPVWGSKVLEGRWKYRAIEYLRYNELMDATNYYRWRMHENRGDNRPEYWEHRPTSYERIAAELIAQGKRTPEDENKLRAFIENDLKPAVLAANTSSSL